VGDEHRPAGAALEQPGEPSGAGVPVEGLQHEVLAGLAPAAGLRLRPLGLDRAAAAGEVQVLDVRARDLVWSLLRLRPGGFPWLTVAGKRLTGWIVIDATIITAASKKAGAAVPSKPIQPPCPRPPQMPKLVEPVFRPGEQPPAPPPLSVRSG
jgi:hypothetical protein